MMKLYFKDKDILKEKKKIEEKVRFLFKKYNIELKEKFELKEFRNSFKIDNFVNNSNDIFFNKNNSIKITKGKGRMLVNKLYELEPKGFYNLFLEKYLNPVLMQFGKYQTFTPFENDDILYFSFDEDDLSGRDLQRLNEKAIKISKEEYEKMRS